jgi:hypothetical protein
MKLLAWLKQFFPHVYFGNRRLTMAVTFEEGGAWHEFPCKWRNGPPHGVLVHSILFADGTTWDALNGWRSESSRVRSTYIVRTNGKVVFWYADNEANGNARGYVKPSNTMTYAG